MQKPDSRTLADLVEENARVRGDRNALTFGAETLTFAAFRDRAVEVARALYATGVRKGDKVGLLLGNRTEWLTIAFGLQYLGAVLVPMNTWYTARETEYVLEHSDISVLIAADRFLKNDYVEMLRGFEPLAEHFPLLRAVVILGGDAGGHVAWPDFLARAAQTDSAVVDAARRDVRGDDLAFMLYTSGSTSRPKGVMLLHSGLVTNPWDIGERLHLDGSDVLLLPVSLFWGLGCENGVPVAWTHGVHIVLQEQFSPDEAIDLIERHRCTAIYGTPNMIDPIARHPARASRDLSSMRKGITPGGPSDIRRVIETFLPLGVNCFGLTETYGFLSLSDASDSVERRSRTHGRPIPASDVRICSTETDEELPAGQVGEIRLGGNVLAGYYKAPEITAASFDRHGRFKTGDLALIDADGFMVFKGRLKELIKSGGMNVSPAEVEGVLAEHPAIAAAFVTGLADRERAEIVAAVVILARGAELTAEEVQAHCRAGLAAYKVPRLVRFASGADIPLTTTGKLHRDRLAELFGPTRQVAS